MGIFGGDVTVVNPDRAPCNRQAETDATGRFIPRWIGSKEGVEDSGDEVFRDSGAVVSDRHLCLASIAVKVDIDGATLR